jgi:hypothetical protein
VEIPKGNTVIYKDNGSLRPGVVVGFTDIGHGKAIIFPGEKVVPTKKLIPVTVPQLEVLTDQVKDILKQYRKSKPEIMT